MPGRRSPSTVCLFLTLSLSFFTPVRSHGFVQEINVDGVRWPGPSPNEQGDFAIRAIDSHYPIEDINSDEMTCGKDIGPARLVADVRPGSTLEYRWTGVEGQWPHDTGPALLYMAPCGGSCTDVRSKGNRDLKWFKAGQVAQGADGRWIQATLFDHGSVQHTIPNFLPAGEYLVRHELIALHLAQNTGGAQFTPSCFQIRLSAPTADITPFIPDGVSFPGGYNAEDPGIHLNPYGAAGSYQFPGPPLVDSQSAPAPQNPPPNPPPPNPSPSTTTQSSSTSTQSPPSRPTNNGSSDNDDDDDTTLCRSRRSKKVRRATRPRVWASRRHRVQRQHS